MKNSIKKSLALFKFYMRFFRGHYLALAVNIFISVLLTIPLLVIAWLTKYAFDVLIPHNNILYLVYAGGIIVLMAILMLVVNMWSRARMLNIVKRSTARLRGELLKKCYGFSYDYYTSSDTAKLHANIVQDTERIDQMSNILVIYFAPSLVLGSALIIVMLVMNWILFASVLLVIPVVYFFAQYIKQKISRTAQRYHEVFASFSKNTLFALQMIDFTRTHAAEKYETKRQLDSHEHLRKMSFRLSFLESLFIATQTTIATIAAVILFLIGGTLVSLKLMTLGQLISFVVVAAMLRRYTYNMTFCLPQLITGINSLKNISRLFAFNQQLPYVGDKKVEFTRKITFSSVSFQYDSKPLLKNINLAINRYSLVGLLGPNGTGKTSMINLLLGFYRPIEGSIMIDGTPYDEIDMVLLRENIAVVRQNSIIMPGTIFDNITYGCPEATLEQVKLAASLATANEFIDQFPNQYDTLVGEYGAKLSGGQRQRIAIARAILRNPALLILDEPTNHLDRMTIRQLMLNIKSLLAKQTVLIISHDEEIISQLDDVYFINNGTIEKKRSGINAK